MKSLFYIVIFLIVLSLFVIETKAQFESNGALQELNDGRNICYSIFGDAAGTPTFYFHGFPGSRLDVQLFNGDSLAKQKGIKLIAVDRPGYSGSSFQEKRQLLDWSNDIAELADSLGIDTFSVIGYSGGGPYALTCAYAIPERLNDVIVISGMVPKNYPEAKKGGSMFIPKLPGFLQNIVLKGMKKMLIEDPDKLMANMNKTLPEVDINCFDNKQVKTGFKNTLSESMKLDHKGAKHDAKIYAKHWGFELSEINMRVHLFHGAADRNIKIETAKHAANELPYCNEKYYNEEGHISLIYKEFDRILDNIKK